MVVLGVEQIMLDHQNMVVLGEEQSGLGDTMEEDIIWLLDGVGDGRGRFRTGLEEEV